ncbi:CRP/FNR family transcriptional regulator, anaerobic regulatory protein [Sphingomonas gellani]|uniref:CRP/FNR family transcriptional regulator, anaerobic regulatory protein n=1 Tax=Sphingomonas gellani TaxID=1166340 RepID=A0A1H7YZ36_9SPHN|nr:Crp/Fnr family transcriptional regulator [Sphingomonas gellani]SEM50499.1 CRP/FNR family transcriptional regulator, anaerobic regulatory protein [Sphingomonas gellani]
MSVQSLSIIQGGAGNVVDRCGLCEGRRDGVCSALTAEAGARLAGIGRTRRLKRGDTLIWDGEDADLVANVRSGMMQLTMGDAEGQEQIVGLAFAGDFVGTPFGARHEQRVVALTETSVCVIRRSDFLAMLSDEPGLSQALLMKTFAELNRAREWMRLLGRKSAEERVASLLLEIAGRSGDADGEAVPLPLSRQQIADVLGLTIETVSRKMRAFSREGVIGLPDLRSFVVHRPVDLERLAA